VADTDVASTTRVLWDIVEPYVAAEGVELDDLEVLGNGRLVRVTLDADGGLGVDRIAEISRGLSRLVDEADPLSGSWTLEVSSPGLERTLRRPRHFTKSIGRQVKVKTHAPIDGERRHDGVLTAADDEGFVIESNDTTRRFAYGDVASARTVYVWKKTERPAKPRSAKKA